MAATLLIFVAGALFALAIAAPLAVVLYRQLERTRLIQNATLNSAIAHRDDELVKAHARTAELERQVDSMHEQGFRVKPPPVVELPEERDTQLLPADVEEFVNAFEEQEDRDLFRAWANELVRGDPHADPLDIIAAMNGSARHATQRARVTD